FSIAGVGDIVSGREGDRGQSQWQFLQTGTWSRSSHSIRIGLDYLRLAPRRHDTNDTLSVIADSLNDLNDSRNVWHGTSRAQTASSVLKEVSLFVQDTWRASPK